MAGSFECLQFLIALIAVTYIATLLYDVEHTMDGSKIRRGLDMEAMKGQIASNIIAHNDERWNCPQPWEIIDSQRIIGPTRVALHPPEWAPALMPLARIIDFATAQLTPVEASSARFSYALRRMCWSLNRAANATGRIEHTVRFVNPLVDVILQHYASSQVEQVEYETQVFKSAGLRLQAGRPSASRASFEQKPILRIVVPLHGRDDAHRRFLKQYAALSNAASDEVFAQVKLVIVYFQLDNVFTNDSKLANSIHSSFSSRLQNATSRWDAPELIILKAQEFSRGLGLQLGSQIDDPVEKARTILFFVDIDMTFTLNFLRRCILHVKKRRRAFAPIVKSMYNNSSEFMWRTSGYGMLCIHVFDFENSGGFDQSIHGWGLEDERLIQRLKRLEGGRFELFRAFEPELIHNYHEKSCEKLNSPSQRLQLNACWRARAMTEASHATLASNLAKLESKLSIAAFPGTIVGDKILFMIYIGPMTPGLDEAKGVLSLVQSIMIQNGDKAFIRVITQSSQEELRKRMGGSSWLHLSLILEQTQNCLDSQCIFTRISGEENQLSLAARLAQHNSRDIVLLLRGFHCAIAALDADVESSSLEGFISYFNSSYSLADLMIRPTGSSACTFSDTVALDSHVPSIRDRCCVYEAARSKRDDEFNIRIFSATRRPSSQQTESYLTIMCNNWPFEVQPMYIRSKPHDPATHSIRLPLALKRTGNISGVKIYIARESNVWLCRHPSDGLDVEFLHRLSDSTFESNNIAEADFIFIPVMTSCIADKNNSTAIIETYSTVLSDLTGQGFWSIADPRKCIFLHDHDLGRSVFDKNSIAYDAIGLTSRTGTLDSPRRFRLRRDIVIPPSSVWVNISYSTEIEHCDAPYQQFCKASSPTHVIAALLHGCVPLVSSVLAKQIDERHVLMPFPALIRYRDCIVPAKSCSDLKNIDYEELQRAATITADISTAGFLDYSRLAMNAIVSLLQVQRLEATLPTRG